VTTSLMYPWLSGDTMGRIDAVIPDPLEKRLRVAVAQRFGGKKGDLTRGLIEAIELWTKSDEATKVGKRLSKTVRDPKTPSGVKENAVVALGKLGPGGVELLADIGGDHAVPEAIRSQALKAIEFSHRR
jgi:hypothetical protein